MLIVIFMKVQEIECLDNLIEDMRLEGLEKHDISIFIEEKVVYIHSRISLKHMLTGIEHAERMSKVFGNRANSTFSRILNSKVKRLSAKMEHKLASLYGRPQVKREKRAIEFVGNLISKLFGNPGPEDWKQNKKNILAMKNAIERQMVNIVQQHHDIDQNRHTINEQNEILRKVTKEVVNNENRINNIDNALTSLEIFLELETMYDAIDEILESLIDIKRDAKSGRCNEKGLNPGFLIEHLRDIESNKNSIGPIFESWEWQRYFEHEMCSLALHENDVWITMRIPIVDQNEQFVRCVPTSNQLWIRNEMNVLGFSTQLLKNKNQDSFMTMLNNNLELCSKLGSARVCNVRKTKFRENSPFAVPVDINHGRILIVTNSSDIINLKMICKSKTTSLELRNHTVIKLPDACTVISKSIEISKIAENASLSLDMHTNEVQEFAMRQIKESKISNFNVPNLIKVLSNTNFNINNNLTRKSLNEISVDSEWSTEKLLLTSSTSVTSLIFVVVAVISIMICIKKCKTKKHVTVVEVNSPPNSNQIDEERCLRQNNADMASDTSDLQAIEIAKKYEPQFRVPSKTIT